MRRFRLYDTRTRQTRPFVPLTPPRVGLFFCGLTPYADAHIGHAKGAVTFDVLVRALRRWGYRPFYLQNVTNLDDRLIARGAEEGVDPMTLADRHFRRWLEAMEELRVTTVNYYPHATDYLPEILAQVGALVDKGFAYVSDGSVYYSVAKFPHYGELSGQRSEALRPGARLEVDPSKRSPEDFVLWKAATPGEPTWESPWGPGRPGWHIEDTAITARLLGNRYDIHGGGLDLAFPHHEAEIAQAEAATGEAPLVNFWMHVGLLTLKGEKMSKSLGNVVSLDENLETFGGEVVRFYYLNVHYRGPLDYVPGKSLEEAREAYETLSAPSAALDAALGAAPPDGGEELPEALALEAAAKVERLDELLADDFRTREAIAELFTWGRTVSSSLERAEPLSAAALAQLALPYDWGREVLGLFEPLREGPGADALRGAVAAAISARARARARGDYGEADRIRSELAAAGLVLEDRAGRTSWRAARVGPR